jgi:hypothetical protein
MAKKINYLASLNVCASELDEPKLVNRKIDDLHTIPEINGVELRFKGNVNSSATSKELNGIAQICENTDLPLKYIHLSSYGLNALEKRPNLMDYFHLIIGHYGRHDNLLGQIIQSIQQKSMRDERFGTKKAINTGELNICDLINNSRKFVVENGSRTENRLSEVYEYAKRHRIDLTFDSGHYALSLLESSDPNIRIPIEPLYKYLGKYGDAYTLAVSKKIKHAHIHGVKLIRGEFEDHKVLSKDTIRGAQLSITRKLLQNADLLSGTVELDQDLRTKENIKITIKNFEDLILN